MQYVAASDKQIAFIKSLVADRDNAAAALRFENGNITKRVASLLIEALLASPKRARVETAQNVQQEQVTDGMYRNRDTDEIYKVQYNRAQGDGRRAYAKKLVIERDAIRDADGKILDAAIVRFDYAPGAMRFIHADWKMSMTEASAFGALYGTCVRCGRTLTREESIARAMGPVCVKYFA